MRRRVDTLLLIGIVGLVAFGIVMVYSASVIVSFTKFQDAQFFFKREVLYALVGLLACVLAANWHYRLWQKFSSWMLPITFLLLLSVFLFSKGEINGANRWIDIGGFSFQPSEVAKFTFIAYLAAWFAARKDKIADFKQSFWPFVAVLLGISVLMLLQPDFGTLTVLIVSAIAIYWVAGMTWKQFVVGLLLLVLGLAAALSTSYRRERLAAYLNPEQDTTGVAYHVTNISIAIGSGGWFGLGFNESRQKRLFLPEPHTDSIFAVTVEELGFVISLLLIGLFGLVLYRSYRVATHAPDSFGRFLATGIATWFAYQIFLNLAAMMQLVPLKGVPLPFVSYGGTNLIVSLFAAGVLLNISRYITQDEVAAVKPRGQSGSAKRNIRYG